MSIHWKAVEQFFTVALFVFQFYTVCNFGKFITSGLGTVRSERVKVADNSSKHFFLYESGPLHNTIPAVQKTIMASNRMHLSVK